MEALPIARHTAGCSFFAPRRLALGSPVFFARIERAKILPRNHADHDTAYLAWPTKFRVLAVAPSDDYSKSRIKRCFWRLKNTVSAHFSAGHQGRPSHTPQMPIPRHAG
jgi:hypothetical protein